jgi:hypothetical protein
MSEMDQTLTQIQPACVFTLMRPPRSRPVYQVKFCKGCWMRVSVKKAKKYSGYHGRNWQKLHMAALRGKATSKAAKHTGREIRN